MISFSKSSVKVSTQMIAGGYTITMCKLLK